MQLVTPDGTILLDAQTNPKADGSAGNGWLTLSGGLINWRVLKSATAALNAVTYPSAKFALGITYADGTHATVLDGYAQIEPKEVAE